VVAIAPSNHFCSVHWQLTKLGITSLKHKTYGQGGGTDPWETGSYDLALEEAHIENFNIVAYTSVIPPGELGAEGNFRTSATLILLSICWLLVLTGTVLCRGYGG
jgi:hypothetical protein